jgi:hypothetical protein
MVADATTSTALRVYHPEVDNRLIAETLATVARSKQLLERSKAPSADSQKGQTHPMTIKPRPRPRDLIQLTKMID